MEFNVTTAGSGVGELVNIVVGVCVVGISLAVLTGLEVANFIVCIVDNCTVAPGFSQEVVVDIVGEGSELLIAISDPADSS